MKHHVFRSLGISGMQKVVRELERRGVALSQLHALEVFGGTGYYTITDYAPVVSSVDAWENDPARVTALRHTFPSVHVLLTDSFDEVKTTSKKYNFIVVDNPLECYGDNFERCEHFDLFPDIFRVAMGETIMVLDVVPQFASTKGVNVSDELNAVQLARRAAFYVTTRPDDISLASMAKWYIQTYREAGFNVEWCFFQRRTFFGNIVYFLVFKIKSYR